MHVINALLRRIVRQMKHPIASYIYSPKNKTGASIILIQHYSSRNK